MTNLGSLPHDGGWVPGSDVAAEVLADDRLPSPLDTEDLLYDQFPDSPGLLTLRGCPISLATRFVPNNKR